MSDFKKLLESDLLDEETKKALSEAIEHKVEERLAEAKEELRMDFARRYEHDKKVMVEAADKMFTEVLDAKVAELNEEKDSLIKAKSDYKKAVKENISYTHKFVTSKLADEIKELREDRSQQAKILESFEKFAIKHLQQELKEFHEDKRALVEAKVSLVKKANEKMEETRKEFVKRAAHLSEGFIKESLTKELSTFRKDIKESRKNHFGKKIFEAFANEFMNSHMSDGTKMKSLLNAVAERDLKLKESVEAMEKANQTIEGYKKKAIIAESRLVREKKMTELLSPLPREKKELMANLLENVNTKDLDRAYRKHVGLVLDDSKKERVSLNENLNSTSPSFKEVTGDKKSINDDETNNISRLCKLAGM